jgi:hypothetical protein
LACASAWRKEESLGRRLLSGRKVASSRRRSPWGQERVDRPPPPPPPPALESVNERVGGASTGAVWAIPLQHCSIPPAPQCSLQTAVALSHNLPVEQRRSQVACLRTPQQLARGTGIGSAVVALLLDFARSVDLVQVQQARIEKARTAR